MDRVKKLITGNDLIILPHNEHAVYDLYLKAISFFWTIGDLDISGDISDLLRMDYGFSTTLKSVLLFFVGVDAIINMNLRERLNDVSTPVDKLFLNFQMSMEDCHFLVYNTVFNKYYNIYNQKDVQKLLMENLNIQRQYSWALDNCGVAGKSLGHTYLANAIMEGLFLQNKFKFIFFLKFNGFCGGLAHINELILRDENLHLEFSKIKYLELSAENRLSEKEVHWIVRTAVNEELYFWEDSLPSMPFDCIPETLGRISEPPPPKKTRTDGFAGSFTYENIRNDTWILANSLLESLGYGLLYETKESNLEFLNAAMLPMKTNYFERKDPEYQTAGNINFKFDL